MKPHLVICRVGKGSLHRAWLGDPAARSYDAWLDAVEDDAPLRDDPARVSLGLDTTKWPRVGALLDERPEAAEYEAVFVPDDDLAMTAADVEKAFAMRRALELDLAQPALTGDSFWSHSFTLACSTFEARYVNCVEVMAPLFSRAALAACRPTFATSVSGWGLDAVWPKLVGHPRDRIAVLDAVPVRHTRPVGSHAFFLSRGVDPREEQRRLSADAGVGVPYPFRHYGGIPRGRSLSRDAAMPRGVRFAARLFAGAPREVRFVPRFLVGQAKTLLRLGVRSTLQLIRAAGAVAR